MTGQLDVVRAGRAARQARPRRFQPRRRRRSCASATRASSAAWPSTRPTRADAVLGELGPEPLDDAVHAGRLPTAPASRERRRLKTLLMNQEFLAGVGNIYADEALWRAAPPSAAQRRRPAAGPGAALYARCATCSTRRSSGAALGRRLSRAGGPRRHAALPERLRPHRQAVSALRPADAAHGHRRAQHALLLVVPAPAGTRANGPDRQDLLASLRC